MAEINLEALDSVFSGITFVDGMSLERLKTKYWWVFNAKINDAVIGEDDYGLVWYSGIWCCGTWKDGTWYSGTWKSGTWENGIWHSYVLDKVNLQHDKVIVVGINNTSSHFQTGTWEDGHFHEGTFGLDNNRSWSSETGYTDAPQTVWKNGIFYTGLIYDSVWYNGEFKSGTFTNSFWLDGKFYSGDFNGFEWLNGKWHGGDFNYGTWYDGYFSQLQKGVLSRFGLANNGKETSVWKNGIFEKGEFHSGLNEVNSKPEASLNHNVTHWKNGQFKNGDWYGGTFVDGEWFYGRWYDGVWSTFSSDWIYPNTVSQGSVITKNYWDNPEYNLIGNTEDFCELLVLSGYTGYTLANSLSLRDFNFNLPSGTTINGFRAKTVRQAYYDYYKGGLIDESIYFNPVVESIDIPNIYPYSYQNSNNEETIYYGDIDTQWITGTTWTSENVDNIVFVYDVQSWQEYSGITDVTGGLYSVALKIYHNTYPTWHNGVWYNGIWNNGAFYDGEFRNGVWIKGDFLGGSML